MAQFARPIADVDDGSWASTPFFSKIDEDIGGGGDDSVVTSEVVGNNTNTSDLDLEATNSGLTDPAVSTGHILRVLWNSSSVRDIIGHFELWQGVPDVGSLIAEATATLLDATEVETAYTLDGTETDAITDYNDLHFTLWGRGSGGGPDRSLVVDAIEFEIPDAIVIDEITGAAQAAAETDAQAVQTHTVNGASEAAVTTASTPIQVHNVNTSAEAAVETDGAVTLIAAGVTEATGDAQAAAQTAAALTLIRNVAAAVEAATEAAGSPQQTHELLVAIQAAVEAVGTVTQIVGVIPTTKGFVGISDALVGSLTLTDALAGSMGVNDSQGLT